MSPYVTYVMHAHLKLLQSLRRLFLYKMNDKQLKFAMETDIERKARLEKTVATTQLRLALETEEERRAKKGMILI